MRGVSGTREGCPNFVKLHVRWIRRALSTCGRSTYLRSTAVIFVRSR